MDIKQIIIDCRDDKKFQEIAFLVDKPEFLKDINKIRKKLKLNKVISSSELRKFANFGNFGNELTNSVEYLINKYHVDNNLCFGLHNIIINGKIHEDDIPDSAAIETLDPLESSFIKVYSKKTQLAITIDEKTTMKDVVKIFRQYQKNIKVVKKDTISNIRRDRKWYWLHLSKDEGGEGKSYLDIANTIPHTDSYRDRDMIRKAIVQYKKKLRVP